MDNYTHDNPELLPLWVRTIVAERDRLREINAELVRVLDKVVLFGEHIDSLSIGINAALVELARNARGALAKAKSEE